MSWIFVKIKLISEAQNKMPKKKIPGTRQGARDAVTKSGVKAWDILMER